MDQQRRHRAVGAALILLLLLGGLPGVVHAEHDPVALRQRVITPDFILDNQGPARTGLCAQ
ncbi:MAG: hypothetical protein ACUVR4_05850 [Anaerolineae bacterium]